MILVSKGIHSHLPPPPNHVPITIRSRLQELIYQADVDTMDVTLIRIITGNYLIYSYIKLNFYLFILFYLLGNLIKTYFGTDYLADIHASLNNADRLRYYVDKIQKEINPQGYGLLGVVYNYSRNNNNFCDYVKRLGKYL